MMLISYGTLIGTFAVMLAYGSPGIQTAALWLLAYYHIAILIVFMWSNLNSSSKTPDLDRRVAHMRRVEAIQRRHRRRRAFIALFGKPEKDDSQ